MRSSIETTLRNAKQTDVPQSTFDKVDNVLRNLENRKDIIPMKPRYKKSALLVAAIVVFSLTLSTVALAHTGVLSRLFMAITDGEGGEMGIGGDSRMAIMEHNYATELSPLVSITEDGKVLELNAYFADTREIWFNFNLSNAVTPDEWTQVLPQHFALTMAQNDGTASKFEFSIDENVESMTFPGGHWYLNRELDVHEFVIDNEAQHFNINTVGTLVSDGSLEITVLLEFPNANAPIGEKAQLQIGNFIFTEMTEGFVEGADNSDAIRRTVVDGIWEFEVAIDSSPAALYSVVNVDEVAEYGIIIHNITASPTATRIYLSMDFSNNAFENFDASNVTISAVSNGEQLRAIGSLIEVNANLVEGWFEFDSIYFDTLNSLTLLIEDFVYGHVVSVPLRLENQN